MDIVLCGLVGAAGRAEANFQPLLHIGDQRLEQKALPSAFVAVDQRIRVFHKRDKDLDDECLGKIFGEGGGHGKLLAFFLLEPAKCKNSGC